MAREHVTILLSVFNGERFLGELLESLLAQTHESWSLVVRDDGSSDATGAVLAEYAGRIPAMRLVDDDAGNVGPAASFLVLLRELNDGLFAFCDQDDVWFPQKLEWCVDALDGRTSPIAAVYTDATVVDAERNPVLPSALADRGLSRPPTFGELLINNAAIGATMVGTAELAAAALDALGEEPEATDLDMHDWWCALVAAYAGDLRLLSAPTMAWRRHDNTVTGETPGSAAGRVRRRLRYLDWSIDVAQRLAHSGLEPVSGEVHEAVTALTDMAPDAQGVSLPGLVRAMRRGVRAWPARRQAGLLLAAARHRGLGR
jgi:rhamnosyltransferase